VAEGPHEGLKGILTVPGRYGLMEGEDGNKYQLKEFLGVELKPAPDADLSAWLDQFKAANPSMVRPSSFCTSRAYM
jgi:hypothetical protein